jgi:hypothetical protein
MKCIPSPDHLCVRHHHLPDMTLTTLDVGCGILALYFLKRFISSRSHLTLPPGPRGLPLVGNVLDMPTSQEWKTFARWGEIYGI